MAEVTLVGSCKKADGIGQNSIGFVSCLHKDVALNVIHTRNVCGDGISPDILSVFTAPSHPPGKIAILTSSIFWYDFSTIFDHLPKESEIKIAYSMIESSVLATRGVELFNEVFDAVVVPDPWLVKTYIESGVTVPIFVLPIALELEDFLMEPMQKEKRDPFVFLNTCAFMERKNHLLLIDAFCEAFCNRDDVELVLHGRRGSSSDSFHDVETKVESLKAKNIRIQRETLSRRDYLLLMQKASCFVSLSKGEGFAVPPREALSLGIPCILTDNTAHTTCCNTGHVRSVPSTILEPAFSPLLFQYSGKEYNCTKEDAVKALLDVYENYPYHLEKAKEGRAWAKKYLPSSLRSKYLSLVKPISIILGEQNEIGDDYLMTSSPKLYEKYRAVLGV